LTTKRLFRVADLAVGDGYKLGSGLIVPRPIGWIGSISSDGTPNLAPYSFFNMVSGVPPTFVFAPGKGGRKDTLDNVSVVRQFTINIVTDEVVEAMNTSSASAPPDVDEFGLAEVTPVSATVVRPPMVAECKANIECVVTDILEVGHPDNGNWLVVGEAVAFHVAENLLDGTRIDQAELKAVGRHVGNSYSRTHKLFDLSRPD